MVGAILNLKILVALCGILLSVAAHELFHVIVHWGEINTIHILPDSQAIVEVIFTPSTDYDLPIEEALAYTITMVTLILTAMLIGDIHDERNESASWQTIFERDVSGDCQADAEKNFEQLATLLGLAAATPTPRPTRK